MTGREEPAMVDFGRKAALALPPSVRAGFARACV
jgi:hypothetical protein